MTTEKKWCTAERYIGRFDESESLWLTCHRWEHEGDEHVCYISGGRMWVWHPRGKPKLEQAPPGTFRTRQRTG